MTNENPYQNENAYMIESIRKMSLLEVYNGLSHIIGEQQEARLIVKWNTSTPEDRNTANAILYLCQNLVAAYESEIRRRDSLGEIQWAWTHLVKLCGCNRKCPVVKVTAKTVTIWESEQTSYRINREVFEAGQTQYRKSVGISMWNRKAEERTEAEAYWLD